MPLPGPKVQRVPPCARASYNEARGRSLRDTIPLEGARLNRIRVRGGTWISWPPRPSSTPQPRRERGRSQAPWVGLGPGLGAGAWEPRTRRPRSSKNTFPGRDGSVGGSPSLGESRGSVSRLHSPGALGKGVRGGAPGAAGWPQGRGARVSEGRRQGLGVRGSAGAAARLAVVPVAAEVHLDGQGAVGAWLVLAAVIWGRDTLGGHQRWPRGENSTGQDRTPTPLPPLLSCRSLVHLGVVRGSRAPGGRRPLPTCPFLGAGATGLPPHLGPSSAIPLPPLSCRYPPSGLICAQEW